MALSVLQQAELARRLGPGQLAWLNSISDVVCSESLTVTSASGGSVLVGQMAPAVPWFGMFCRVCSLDYGQVRHSVWPTALSAPVLLDTLVLAIEHLEANGETPGAD